MPDKKNEKERHKLRHSQNLDFHGFKDIAFHHGHTKDENGCK